jgi:hypothetical protein
VFMAQAQTGCPMTYMSNGHQHIVLASGGLNGAELLCYRLPLPAPAADAAGGRGGRGGRGGAAPGTPPPDGD